MLKDKNNSLGDVWNDDFVESCSWCGYNNACGKIPVLRKGDKVIYECGAYQYNKDGTLGDWHTWVEKATVISDPTVDCKQIEIEYEHGTKIVVFAGHLELLSKYKSRIGRLKLTDYPVYCGGKLVGYDEG